MLSKYRPFFLGRQRRLTRPWLFPMPRRQRRRCSDIGAIVVSRSADDRDDARMHARRLTNLTNGSFEYLCEKNGDAMLSCKTSMTRTPRLILFRNIGNVTEMLTSTSGATPSFTFHFFSLCRDSASRDDAASRIAPTISRPEGTRNIIPISRIWRPVYS